MVSRSNIGDDVVIRMVVANESINRDTLDRFLERVVHHGKKFLEGFLRREVPVERMFIEPGRKPTP